MHNKTSYFKMTLGSIDKTEKKKEYCFRILECPVLSILADMENVHEIGDIFLLGLNL